MPGNRSAADVVVLGAGGVGSAALFHLARRGHRVLGLDAFPPGHDRGSSHGETRIIRLAYTEGPDYVPLLRRSYELWDELAAASGERLFHENGLLQVGRADGGLVEGVLRSAREHDLALDVLDAAEAAARFPGFVVPDGYQAVFERRAGVLRVERCVLAHLDLARAAGAELRQERVRGWARERDGFRVETDAGVHLAGRLVIAAGAWAADLVPELSGRLTVTRQPVFWYPTDDARYRADRGAPPFIYDLPGGLFYGVPALDDDGLKVGQHRQGRVVDDPLAVDRDLDPADAVELERFLAAHLPGVSRRRTRHAVCLYTRSADEDFLVGRVRDVPGACFAAGLSGHGFKLTPVLGEILADLVEGETTHPIAFLSPSRLGPS